MRCKICGDETNRIRIIYKEGNKVEGCSTCTSTYINSSIDFRCTDSTMGFSIGTGHLKDIRSRKLDPITKQVYRDTGKKYFVVNSTMPKGGLN